MSRNKYIMIFFTLLMCTYIYLSANEIFYKLDSPEYIVLSLITIGLILTLTPLFLKSKWHIKLIGVCSCIFLLLYGIPQLNLHKFSLKKYTKQNIHKYEAVADIVKSKELSDIGYLSCLNDTIMSKPKISVMSESHIETICQLLNQTDAKEIFKNSNNDKFLFSMHRFIDNGYGMLYSNIPLTDSNAYKERINGLQITSYTKLFNKWYFVSYT